MQQIKTRFEAIQYAVKRRQEPNPPTYSVIADEIYDLGFKRASGSKWQYADVCRWVITAEPTLRSYKPKKKVYRSQAAEKEDRATKAIKVNGSVDDRMDVLQIVLASSIKNKFAVLKAILEEEV